MRDEAAGSMASNKSTPAPCPSCLAFKKQMAASGIPAPWELANCGAHSNPIPATPAMTARAIAASRWSQAKATTRLYTWVGHWRMKNRRRRWALV